MFIPPRPDPRRPGVAHSAGAPSARSPGPAGPSAPRAHTPITPPAGSRLSLPAPLPLDQRAASHRRGGFLSCTVSMALPAAAQTRSVLHPPPGLLRARPADPPTLPLSAPTGSGELLRGGAGPRGPGLDHVVRARVTWHAGAEPRRLGDSFGVCRQADWSLGGVVSCGGVSPRHLVPQTWNPSLPRATPLISQTERLRFLAKQHT